MLSRDGQSRFPDWVFLLLLLWVLIELLCFQQQCRGDDGNVAGRSIVPVQLVQSGQVVAAGSAVLFDEGSSPTQGRGWALLTAKHVVAVSQSCPNGACPVRRIEVYLGGQWRAARVRSTSKNADLALLIVACPTDQVLSCLASESPRVGERIIVAGMSLGLEYQAGAGVVTSDSGVMHELEGARSVIPGESGGGVFDARGDLCGIIVSHRADAPWICQYVGLGELRRFVAAAWDSRVTSPDPVHGARVPRLAGDTGAAGESASPAVPADPSVVPVPEPPPARTEPESEPQLPTPLPEASESSPRIESPQRDSPGKPSAWWDFLASGIGLGVTIAGAAATGGAAWPVVIGPALKTWRAGREVLRGVQGAARRDHIASLVVPAAPDAAPSAAAVPAPAPEPSTVGHHSPVGNSPASEVRAPFPRQLDETRELLRLRQSEGRVGVLDQLRGMLLDDQVRILRDQGTPEERAVLSRLMDQLDDQVAEIAPLSVQA